MSNKCNKNCNNQNINLKGPRGFRGDAGPVGPQGPSGPQGIPGGSGPSNPADIDIVAIDDITVSSVTVGDLTTYTVGRDIIDTGWVDLEGFDYYQGVMEANKPQVRRMSNQIHFRGELIIPIADGGGAAVPLTTEDTVRNTFRKDVEVSTGNAFISNSEIFFNSTGAAGGVVIPTSVLDASTNLDNTYTLNNQISTRQTVLDYLGVSAGISGTVLMSSTFQVSITNTKQLKITPLEAQEQNAADVQNCQGASPLNKITSHWQIRYPAMSHNGDYVGSNRLGDTNTSLLTMSFGAAFVIGQWYTMISLGIGDDFANVGYDIGNGPTWQATDVTATTYLSSEIAVASIAERPISMPQTENGGAFSTLRYPFMADAGVGTVNTSLANDLGGFKIRLDGLMAYLAPAAS